MTTGRERLRGTFVDVGSLVFWVGLGLTIYGMIHLTPLVLSSATLYPGPGFLAAVLWGLYGLILAFIVYRLELFERRSPVTMLGAFLWGAVVVAGIGTTASPAMTELVGKLMGSSLEDWVPAVAAPLVEEPLKMLGVMALAFIPGARINSALDGLFFGLIVGLGFEVTESFLYTVQGAAQEGGDFMIVVLTFILRGVVGGLWNHPTYTAITGAGVGYFFSSKAPSVRRWLALAGSLVAAMVLHGFFDSPLLEGDPLTASILKGLPALALVLVLLRLARNRERAAFESIAEGAIPADLISEEELRTLLKRRTRRKERKKMRRRHGLAAAHALRRLQRSQIQLVGTVGATGIDSPKGREAAVGVEGDRRVLEDAVAQSADS